MTSCVRVVIVGAGPAGLFAAAALAAHADEVLVLDRDRLPREPVPREGVPQDRHWNRVDRQGLTTIEGMLPGFTTQAMEAGGRPELGGLTMRRPSMEMLVRRRVSALPGVRLIGRTSAIDLVHDRDLRRVRGVVVADLEQSSTTELRADLVVDASGQHTRFPAWLARRGIPMTEDRMRINATFVTREFTRAQSPCDPLVTRHLVPDDHGRGDWGRSAVVMPAGERWLITLAGSHGLRPPRDLAGFTSYASEIHEPLARLALRRDPVGNPAVHQVPATITRRIDPGSDFPEGLVLVGDSWHTQDPLAGSGLTAAAVSAAGLADLAAHASIEGLGRAWLSN